MFPYLKAIAIIMAILRVVLLCISYKHIGICRFYIYFQILDVMVQRTFPRDYGEFHSDSMMMLNYVIFLQYSFRFWPSFAMCMLSQLYEGTFVRIFIYNWPANASLFLDLIGKTFLLGYNCLVFFVLFYWLGFIYIEGTQSLVGNELLLNGLKEGVFIIEHKSGKVMF